MDKILESAARPADFSPVKSEQGVPKPATDNQLTRRLEPRTIVDEYYSVEFSVNGTEYSYQFKIWNVSARGLCLVVRPDSDLIRHIKVGDRIHMKYYRSDASKPSDFIWTQIKHISKDEAGKFRNHYLVGLSITDN